MLGELDVSTSLLKEDEISPNEYYEFVESVKKKRRKRASSIKKSQ